MAKSALPIILLGGGAAILLMGGKKKTGGKKSSPGAGNSGGSSGSSSGASSGGGGIPSSKDWTPESNKRFPKGVTVDQVRERICFVWDPPGDGGIDGGVWKEKDYIIDNYHFEAGAKFGDMFPVMGTKAGTLQLYYDFSLGKGLHIVDSEDDHSISSGPLGWGLDPGSVDWNRVLVQDTVDLTTFTPGAFAGGAGIPIPGGGFGNIALQEVDSWKPVFDEISRWLGSREHLSDESKVMVNREIVRFMVYIAKKAIAVLGNDDNKSFYSGGDWYCNGGGAYLSFDRPFSSDPFKG